MVEPSRLPKASHRLSRPSEELFRHMQLLDLGLSGTGELEHLVGTCSKSLTSCSLLLD